MDTKSTACRDEFAQSSEKNDQRGCFALGWVRRLTAGGQRVSATHDEVFGAVSEGHNYRNVCWIAQCLLSRANADQSLHR